MDRVKFVASLKEDVRNRFITNCIDCNLEADFFDWWLKKEDSNWKDGITGAFTWSTTREGHSYWARVQANIK